MPILRVEIEKAAHQNPFGTKILWRCAEDGLEQAQRPTDLGDLTSCCATASLETSPLIRQLDTERNTIPTLFSSSRLEHRYRGRFEDRSAGTGRIDLGPAQCLRVGPQLSERLIPSLIAWAKSQPPGNVARVSFFRTNYCQGLLSRETRRFRPATGVFGAPAGACLDVPGPALDSGDRFELALMFDQELAFFAQCTKITSGRLFRATLAGLVRGRPSPRLHVATPIYAFGD